MASLPSGLIWIKLIVLNLSTYHELAEYQPQQVLEIAGLRESASVRLSMLLAMILDSRCLGAIRADCRPFLLNLTLQAIAWNDSTGSLDVRLLTLVRDVGDSVLYRS